MQVAAVIPVKTFSRAKTRLGLPQEKTEELCKAMLEKVLSATSRCDLIHKTLVVTKDEAALNIAKRYNAIEIADGSENGVNHAVALAEKYMLEHGFDTSIVLPQDIPLIRPEDIALLMSFQKRPQSMIVVPSRKFDGTNALVRNPVNVVETHYDEDSYKIHLTTAKSRNIHTSFALISRIMWDVDDMSDLRFVLGNSGGSPLLDDMRKILG